VALIAALALGLWLRWRFIAGVNLYPDEFVTLLAIKMIREKGAPLLPSGLFYDHGLLFSYLGSLVAGGSEPAVAVRLLSLICGGLTIGLTYWVGQRWYSPGVGLIAATGLAIAPAAIEWSGRARMYALLQLLVLLTLVLTYEGLVKDQVRRRWAALLAYLGATLTQFAAVALAPPLVLAAVLIRRVGEQGAGSREEGGGGNRHSSLVTRLSSIKRFLPEIPALAAILLIAFLVKRLGQPKGIEALDAGAGEAVSGLWQVLAIYGDLSLHPLAGWQAISPFYLDLPALIFTPFALVAAGWSLLALVKRGQGSREQGVGQLVINKEQLTNPFSQPSNPPGQLVINKEQLTSSSFQSSNPPALQPSSPPANLPIFQFSNLPIFQSSTLFLSLILFLTTLEMIFLVSPDRRDDKYLFMLLPVLLLLGAQGMAVTSKRLLGDRGQGTGDRGQGIGDRKLRLTHHLLFTLYYSPFPKSLFLGALIVVLAWPAALARVGNTGDDYAAAFAYVQAHWRDGDKILTGTPAAAYFYLGRTDFYSVQRRGGYDYRLLTLNNRPVDRWLGSPAVRTEAELHQTLAAYQVWLVLERWGLQREYYDLPFQQQLLAQTDLVSESQGIFVLKSKANPQPIRLEPEHAAPAVFANLIRLEGYTVEPESVKAGESLRLTLYWQALGPAPHDYTVFVHVRSAQGLTVVQADHRPLDRLYPSSIWPAGETIRETSDLPLPAGLSPGRHDLWVGLYRLETLERLPVQNDTSGENAVRLGPLELE
jgi:hypothetical protein